MLPTGRHQRSLTKEHVVPRSWGGNNTLLNKLPCCKRCNESRDNKALEHWLHQIRCNEKIPKYEKTMLEANIEHVIDYVQKHGQKLYR